MENSILQVEKTNANDFENKIVNRVEKLINDLAKKMLINEPDELMSRQETADYLKISLVSLWTWTKNNLIPAHKIGNKVRYKKSEILESLQKMNKFSS